MCLITNNPEQIAKEDITCYKVIYLKDNSLLSFYYDFEYILNKLYKTTTISTYYQVEGFISIEEAFHSYKSIRSAIEFYNKVSIYIRKSIVVKCIIPKGAKFYQDNECFASNQLIIKQIL